MTGVSPGRATIAATAGQARVWRAYFTCMGSADLNSTGICSSTTSDGITFTADPGVRITRAAAGVDTLHRLMDGDVLGTHSGTYRMYFSDGPYTAGAGTTEAWRVMSAVSTDLLSWTIEPGIRMGGGGSAGAYAAKHPGAALLPDGRVVLFATENGMRPTTQPPAPTMQGMWYAVSSDGLNFAGRKQLDFGGRFLDDATAVF